MQNQETFSGMRPDRFLKPVRSYPDRSFVIALSRALRTNEPNCGNYSVLPRLFQSSGRSKSCTTPLSITTTRSARRLTEMEFAGWVGAAAPGDRLEYHRGFLAVDTIPVISKLPETERSAMKMLASRAWWASEQRLVHLVQERLGPDLFAYLAIARPKPKHAEVSLAALLVDAEAEAA